MIYIHHILSYIKCYLCKNMYKHLDGPHLNITENIVITNIRWNILNKNDGKSIILFTSLNLCDHCTN